MPVKSVCCLMMFVVVSHATKRIRISTRVLWFWIVIFGMWVSVLADSTPSAYTSTHDVVLSTHDTSSFNIHFSSPVPAVVLLRFHLDSPGVLASIADRTVSQNTSSPITISLRSKAKGHCTISANSSLPRDRFNVDEVYVRVNVLESFGWSTFSAVVGWMYFIAWTVSFYPQIYENHRRKSVIGLNFDFLALNIVGFTFYSVFNCCLFWSRRIQEMYFSVHPYGLVPVASNDVVFGLHAVFASAVTITQCLMYERGSQRVSRATLLLLCCFAVVILVALVVVVCDVISWLQFIYVFSYVKLVITIVKYVPQAWFNYRRRSTEGWSIGNVLLDFTGGSLSILQMFVEAYNYDDWSSIFGNPTKFGLGAFSVLFDVLFVVQHYWLYRNNTSYVPIVDSTEVATEPISV